MTSTSQETARRILEEFSTWAIVGCSPDRAKPAHYVPAFLQSRGFRIVPVNPTYAGETILGERCYATLDDAAGDVDIEVVDLFRRSHLVPPHVPEAVRAGAKALWMQMGIVNEDAASEAREAGLLVVMDRCPKVDIPMLLGNSFRARAA